MKMKNIAIAMIMGAASLTMAAQNTQSGYFVEDYTYRFQMNPAYGNSKGFVSMPGLGNLNIGVSGNLNLSDVLYNLNGKTTTFMNPGISAQEAMSNFSDVNKLSSNIRIGILSVGFKGFGGYNTVSVNARTMVDAHLPKSLFSLLKEGVTNSTYSIEDTRVKARAFAEVALSHSHDINENLRIGATAKILLGAGDVEARLDNAKLVLGQDSWSIQSNADVHASLKGLKYDTDINKDSGHRYVSDIDVDGAGLGGFGVAFDLGAVYKAPFLDGLTLSASLLDLGFISWSNDMVASTQGVKTFDTDKYTFNVDNDAPNSFKNEWKDIKGALTSLYELDDLGDMGGRTTGVGATMNIGAEYAFPLYKKLTFGLLNTTRFQGDYSWTDFRLSANVAPVKCFDASVNVAAGTYGTSFGWLANLHVTGFNLFLGMDHTFAKMAKQGVPLSSNAQVNFGLNFPF